MQQLLKYLRSIQIGTIGDATELASRLAACWDEFDGADAEGMDPDKLHGRMEDISWHPPVLSFTIERHGGTV
jgi:hypothetical protein